MLGNEITEDMVNKLLKQPPVEEGGLIAISGFYFQMLVFIEYMIEMIQGKWTFLALEYHDDIIAGNEESDLIRFIQVKTSNQATISIADSSVSMYNRTTGKSGNSIGKKRNNSWLDKVIENSMYVKDLENLNIEFDIITDYSIYNSKEIEISLYNELKRGKIIPDDDHIYKKLIDPCFDQNGISIDYQDRYGIHLKKMLGNVCFIQRSKIASYRKQICNDFSKLLGSGIRIDETEINWLIGELLSKCAKRESGSVLFLKKDEMEEIRLSLKKKAVDEAKITVNNSDATELLKKGMKSILSKLSDCNSKTELELEMSKYKDVLLEKISEKNTLQSLIYRFSDGKKPTLSNDEKDYSEDLIIFLKTSLLLFLVYDRFLISDSFQTLLIKEAFHSIGNIRIGFLNLGLELDFDEGVQHLKNIIDLSSEEEQLEMLWRSTSLYTIFHGNSLKLTNPIVIEIETTLKPEVAELESSDYNANIVSPVITIIPESSFTDLYSEIRKTKGIEEFKIKVNEVWELLRRSGEHG